MKCPRPWGLVAVILALLTMTCPGWRVAFAGRAVSATVAIVLSEHIRPYQEARSSLERALKRAGLGVKVFEMEEEGERPSQALRAALSTSRYLVWAGIGPKATRFLWSGGGSNRKIRRIYGMVLYPQEIIGDGGCGVSMNIPLEDQIEAIKGLFPGFRRIGILYDPKYNEAFVREARRVSQAKGIRIISIAVSSKAEIPKALGPAWARIDALWLIPDFTVISEPVVRYIIKEGLANQTATIGYNRFFFRTGAIMSFVLDYGRIGEQMATLCLDAAAGRPCREVVPYYGIWVNSRVLDILGLKITNKGFPNLRIMP